MSGPGGAVLPVVGLVDTGADTSLLPLELAERLGHGLDVMTRQMARQVQGRFVTWRSHAPTQAAVPELPEQGFWLDPVFVKDFRDALWGRRDFMRAFDVLVSESRRRYELRPPADAWDPRPAIERSQP